MRIDVHVDRPGHNDQGRPVENREGVFAHLDVDELSEVEAKRADVADAKVARQARGTRKWLPGDVSKYLTRLYQRFSKPGGAG